ncbi:hypothetical protein [Pseudoxanthomonas sp. JBR18]|uniref:hypothetical protein n=1 Tax=Pseudoxanthomonas sp. JBR18 TaxID=2969308 RepID=UPI002305152F|nr:hypothetical protein [Pseudoxanthomonas sp. JBR18]WCE06261.1 hypothetical protein PJ250_10085 [Pseudoxanthomonas sp. JBR18]
MKLGPCFGWLVVAAGLTGCGPKAPDQALQISGAVQGQAITGFVLPQTGQVSVMLGDQACQGVLSDFKDDPRTGLLLCKEANGSAAYLLSARMERTDAGHLVLRRRADRQSFTTELSSQFDAPLPKPSAP